MTAFFDLNLLPYLRIKGHEWPQLPGLMACAPPRRSARGREDDRLVIHLVLSGNTPFSSAEYNQLTTGVADCFYRTPGALTSALRAGANSVNQFLIERNMRTTGKGQYVVGRLILAVLRESQLFLAQCGPTHVFHLTGGEAHHLYEEQGSKPGLGAGQTLPIHFSQVTLLAGDILALCSSLPAGWEEVLQVERGSFEALRRKLLSVGGDDLNAVLVQAQSGKGALNILHGASSVGEAHAVLPPQEDVPANLTADLPTGEMPEAEASQARQTSQVASGQPASRFARLLTDQPGESPQAEDASIPPAPEDPSAVSPQEVKKLLSDLPAVGPNDKPLPEPFPRSAGEQAVLGVKNDLQAQPARRITRPATAMGGQKATRPGRFVNPHPAGGEIPEISRPTSPQRQQVFRGMAKWLRGVKVFTHNTSEKIKAFLPNLLPNLRDDEPRVTGTSMMFIALVIPVLVVMVAITFYNRHGRTASYQENFDQAWAASLWAAAQTNPADVRVGWERTLYYLNIADDYQDTEDLRALHLQAQTSLDNLDSILRLDFSPAIVGGLSQTVEVSRLAATSTDLYLLDSSRGSVQRYYAGSQGYQPDTQFNCGPDVFNGITVGPLIDIIAAPKVNFYSATLIALDANGNLLFCRPSPNGPVAVHLAAPELGWSAISGFTMDLSTSFIYVLDPLRNAIWYYAPDEEGEYITSQATMFFGAQVPVNMPNVIDMATNGADMYLLFNDGHVAACTLMEFHGVPKRCSDPAQFVDTRPERLSGATISDAYFTQMTFTEAPDQSLYIFDPLTQAIYRFSPRPDSLILQGQFRASEEDRARMAETSATAMVISPSRYIFISVNGQVYFSTDVP